MNRTLLAIGYWLLAATTSLAQSAPAPWDGSISGSLKTEGNTIFIYTPADLAAIHSLWDNFPKDGHHYYEGCTIKLMNDLDMNGQNGHNFQALTIGWSDGNRFGGVFDGQGHTIKNLWIDGKVDGRALFGWICGGDILNLKLENPIVRAGDDNDNGYVAALCARMENNSVISHCAVIGGRVEGWNWDDDDDCIGAICGWADKDNNLIEYCYSNTDVYGHKQVGGIVGKIESNSGEDNTPVRHCYYTGTIHHGGDEYFAAIAGERYGNPLLSNFYLNRNDGVKGTGNQSKHNGSSDDPNAAPRTDAELKAPLLFGTDNLEWIYPHNGYPELKVFFRYKENDTFYEKSVGYMDSDASKAVPGYLKIVSNASSPYTVELINILPGASGSNFTLKGDCQPYFSSQQLRMVTLPSNAFQSMGSVSTVTLPATLTTIAAPQRHHVQNGFALYGNGTGCIIKDGGLYDLSQHLFITAPKSRQTLTIYQQYANSIADYAFENMSALSKLYIDTYVPAGTVVDNNTHKPPVITLSGTKDNTFSGCPAGLDIYVKDGTTQELFVGQQGPKGYGYSNADGWDAFYSDHQDVVNHLHSYFPVKCNAGGMSTLMLGYPVELPAGVKAWWAHSFSGGNIRMERLTTQIVPALTPVLLTYEGTEQLNLSRYEGANPGAATDYEDNLFKGSIDPGGHTMTSSELTSNFFTLGRPTGDTSYNHLGFYPYHPVNDILPSYVAWIASSDIPSGARWELSFDDDDVTALKDVAPSLSQEEQPWYDLQGRKISEGPKPTAKGLYIVNGRKVVIK